MERRVALLGALSIPAKLEANYSERMLYKARLRYYLSANILGFEIG